MEPRQSEPGRRLSLGVLFLLALFASSAVSFGADIAVFKTNRWVGGTNTYFALNTGTFETVVGRVTSPFLTSPFVTPTGNTAIFIQDATAGIRVESSGTSFKLETNSALFALGVEVTCYGELIQSNGMRSIRPNVYNGNAYDAGNDFYISSAVTSPIAPLVTTIANYLANAEDYEGQFIRINSLTVGTNAWTYRAKTAVSVTDATGVITLYIDPGTEVAGQLPPTNAFDLIGQAIQFTTAAIPSNGYEITAGYYSNFIQTVGQEAPQISCPGTVAAIAGSPFTAYAVAQDLNAGDALTLITTQSPPGSVFTMIGPRAGRLTWTPGMGDIGTTNIVFFEVSDGVATNTASMAIQVRGASGGPGFAWVNEFHYDNTGTDTNEGIELAGEAGIDLANYFIIMYDGDYGGTYRSNSFSGLIDDEGQGYGAVWLPYPLNGLRNPWAGIALCHVTNGLLQFISYGGSFTATNDVAAGIASIDVGLTEGSSTPVGYSLQLQGTGTNYEAFTWSGPMAHTRDELNGAGQIIIGPVNAKVAYSGLSLNPAAPPTNLAFDIVSTITPNYSASNLVPTAWYRINAGTWTSIGMADLGANYWATTSQVPGQTSGTLVEYFLSTAFEGPGTNSPTVSLTNSYLIQNFPPVFAPIGNKRVTESNLLSFAVTATDTEFEVISLSMSNAPAGATLDSTNGNGTFYWAIPTPTNIYTTTFYAVDSSGFSSTSITITVVPKPVIESNDLVYYDFDFGTANFTNIPAYVVPQLDVSIFTNDIGSTNYSGNPSSGKAYGTEGWNVLGHYCYFTVLVSNGYQMACTGFKVDSRRSNTGPAYWILRYSGDSFGTDLATGTNPTAFATGTAALSLTALTNIVTFRIYATNATGATGTLRLDNVRLQGSISPVTAYQDGIPVAWWERYGLGPTNTAANDNDGDGFSNWEEYVSDTEPTNGGSYFPNRVTNGTGYAVMTLIAGPPTTNTRMYDAWWNTNLVDGPWNAFNFNVTGAANGAAVFMTVTNSEINRFYRTGVKVP